MPAKRAAAKPVIERTDGPPIPYASNFELTPIGELLPYAGNPKEHGSEQVEALAAALVKFGFMRPVVRDTDGTIRAGHGIVLGAQRLGLTHVPTVCAAHLGEAELAAYVIADNKLAERSTWNVEVLKAEVAQLREVAFDTAVLGFEVEELEFKDWGGALETDPGSDDDEDGLPLDVAKVTVVHPKRHKDSVMAAVRDAVASLDLDGVEVK